MKVFSGLVFLTWSRCFVFGFEQVKYFPSLVVFAPKRAFDDYRTPNDFVYCRCSVLLIATQLMRRVCGLRSRLVSHGVARVDPVAV